MIVVTGAAGFIGSNIIKQLNACEYTDILAVDNLKNGKKCVNLADCDILDYMDKHDFLELITQEDVDTGNIQTIFHQGACSSTTEWDGKYMMKNNYDYSKALLHFAIENDTSFIYASSAATYGAGSTFVESREYESPLNVYGYSKFQFDQYARRMMSICESQIVGLRYFNVYGPGEQHKGGMASVAYHLNEQMKQNGVIKLFEGSDGYADGEQRRDFVYIDDVVDVNLWFMDNPDCSGIYNVGTGRSQTFNEVADAVLEWYGEGELEYIPFPDHLKGCYQSFTEADISALRELGYDQEFSDVAAGVSAYLDTINET